MLRDIPVQVMAVLLLADQEAGDVCGVKLSTIFFCAFSTSEGQNSTVPYLAFRQC